MTTDAEVGVRGGSVTSHAEQATPRSRTRRGLPGAPRSSENKSAWLKPLVCGTLSQRLQDASCRKGHRQAQPLLLWSPPSRSFHRSTHTRSSLHVCGGDPGRTRPRSPVSPRTAGVTAQGGPAHTWHVLSPLRSLWSDSSVPTSVTQQLRPCAQLTDPPRCWRDGRGERLCSGV